MKTLLIRICAILIGGAIGYRIALKPAVEGAPAPAMGFPYMAVAVGAALGLAFIVFVPFLFNMARPVTWSNAVVQVVTEEDLKAFLDSAGGQPALVDFYASWCPPCRAMAPNADALADEGVHVAVVDIEKGLKLAKEYEVNAVPTLVVFRNGEVAHREEGYHTLDALRALAQP